MAVTALFWIVFGIIFAYGASMAVSKFATTG
jgi:hypothetical protein